MPTPPSTLASEFEAHVAQVKSWSDTVRALSVRESRKQTAERFCRDCQIFIDDVEATSEPSLADINDLCDRRNSLEVQYLKITA